MPEIFLSANFSQFLTKNGYFWIISALIFTKACEVKIIITSNIFTSSLALEYPKNQPFQNIIAPMAAIYFL
jgi:hypothetical protein